MTTKARKRLTLRTRIIMTADGESHATTWGEWCDDNADTPDLSSDVALALVTDGAWECGDVRIEVSL